MTKTLPQLAQTVEIVGTLKSLDLEISQAKNGKNAGKNFVKGKVVVSSEHDNKVHEHQISVFQMETSKLYKGVMTMMEQYKTIEKHGEEADRIRVTGEIELEEYYGKQDKELRSFNKIKGVFFNRLDADTDAADKAIASAEVVVKSFSPYADSETGEILHHNVKCFTIGYGERIVEIKKAIVSDELAGPMENLYQPGTTGRLTFKINNYAEKQEKENVEEAVSMTHGFGSEEKPEENRVFTKYVNNYEITGGDLPLEEPRALTPEQIKDAERKLALAREELKQAAESQAGSTPSTQPTGFGTGFGAPNDGLPTGMTNASTSVPTPPPAASDLSADDMPDF